MENVFCRHRGLIGAYLALLALLASPDAAKGGIGRVRGAFHWACCTRAFFRIARFVTGSAYVFFLLFILIVCVFYRLRVSKR